MESCPGKSWKMGPRGAADKEHQCRGHAACSAKEACWLGRRRGDEGPRQEMRWENTLSQAQLTTPRSGWLWVCSVYLYRDQHHFFAPHLSIVTSLSLPLRCWCLSHSLRSQWGRSHRPPTPHRRACGLSTGPWYITACITMASVGHQGLNNQSPQYMLASEQKRSFLLHKTRLV